MERDPHPSPWSKGSGEQDHSAGVGPGFAGVYADPVPDSGQPPSAEEPDDAEITRRFVAGERDALALVYQRWGPLVLALARRAVGPVDAEDVTQQVFVSAWRTRQGFDPDRGSLGAWLTGITRHRIADHLRTRHRSSEVATDPKELPAPNTRRGAAAAGLTDEVATALTVAEELEQIGEPQRTIVRLAYYQQLSHQHIAERVGIPVGTVKSHLSRTLHRLRDHLGDEEGESGARRIR